MNHLYLSQLIFNRPLAISERKLDTILGVLGPHFEGRVLPRVDAGEQTFLGRTEETNSYEGLAVISVLGSLVNRTFGMEAWSGLETYHDIRGQLAQAMSDPGTTGIVLDFDSCGGDVSGCFDLVDAIHSASQQKPILALVDENCFSAAYALASAANRIVLPRTGAVGSVGVLAVHMDQSAMDEQDGLKYTFIKAGERKDELNPHAPLKSEARARLQGEVDRVYDIFIQTVAKYRGLSAENVRETQAGIFFGQEAKDAGLVDAIQSREDGIGQFMEDVQQRSKPSVSFYGIDMMPKLGATQQGDNDMGKTDIVKPIESNTSTPAAAAQQSTAPAQEPATQPEVQAAVPPQPKVEGMPDQAARSYMAEISQLCQLAGKPQLASKFIEKGIAAHTVRTTLLEHRAAEDEALEIVGQVPLAPAQGSQVTMESSSDIYARWQNQMAGRS